MANDDAPDRQRWRQLMWICAAELGALSLWFSATAVIPALRVPWLDAAAKAWLSMAVTLGFVTGTLLSVALTLVDAVGARRLFTIAALLGAAANAALLLVIDHQPRVIACRFVTGLAMAGTYPPGMKLAASWFARDRGLAVGSLVGALTAGAAVPHLLNASGGLAWERVIIVTSLGAVAAAAVMLLLVRDGPHVQARAAFHPRAIVDLVRSRPIVLANLGYFGHMWELYAMWTWIGLYLLEALTAAGVAAAPRVGSLATAAVIGAGAVGCIAAGVLADRIGRTATTMLAMTSSGLCAAVIGFVFHHPAIVVAVAVVWGVTVIADSAQFSTAISELAPPAYVGTALSLQTGLGFLLTLVSIRLVPVMIDAVGWAMALAFLAPGPFIGTIAMGLLRALPDSKRLAHGRR
jgi:MFS family permease